MSDSAAQLFDPDSLTAVIKPLNGVKAPREPRRAPVPAAHKLALQAATARDLGGARQRARVPREPGSTWFEEPVSTHAGQSRLYGTLKKLRDSLLAQNEKSPPAQRRQREELAGRVNAAIGLVRSMRGSRCSERCEYARFELAALTRSEHGGLTARQQTLLQIAHRLIDWLAVNPTQY